MARLVSFTDETTEEAAALLRAGALVSFPTETVYGLGANALDDTAVAGIYAAKNRPSFNPLIVHVPDIETARRDAHFSDLAERVAAALWPGPLSLVLPRTKDCPLSKLVSAGLDTVAIRVPASAPARRLLVAAKVPVAGPSANKSGQLSPTEARHVADGFGDEVALVLDGGACVVGLESTVLDLSTETPTLLRAGGVTHEALEEVIAAPVAVAGVDDTAPKSPGMMSRHYAPRTPLRMNASEVKRGEALLGFGGSKGAVEDLSPAGDLVEAAANLFRMLHELDGGGYAGIAVVPIPESGLGRAINDRLRRAARG
ncbi:MAG: L-threonylcarbamoyladenylate synthase [Alphaproteobacteria bacterium]